MSTCFVLLSVQGVSWKHGQRAGVSGSEGARSKYSQREERLGGRHTSNTACERRRGSDKSGAKRSATEIEGVEEQVNGTCALLLGTGAGKPPVKGGKKEGNKEACRQGGWAHGRCQPLPAVEYFWTGHRAEPRFSSRSFFNTCISYCSLLETPPDRAPFVRRGTPSPQCPQTPACRSWPS